MTIARLSLRLSAPIVLVCALGIGLTVFLNVGKFDRTLAEVEESRLRFSLNELRTTLETGLDLGLPVTGLGNAQLALDRELSTDRDIVSVSVIDPAGTVVFNSGSAPASFAALSTIAHNDWLLREEGSVTVGTKLTNNLGVASGAVVLRYATRARSRMVGAVSAKLSTMAAITVLLATLVLAGGIHLILRGSR
jgi:hypothetical protein